MALSDGILKKIETQIEFSNNLNINLITSVKKTNEILSKDVAKELRIHTGLLKGIIGVLSKSSKNESKGDKSGKGVTKFLGKLTDDKSSTNLEKANGSLVKITSTVKEFVNAINELDEKKFDKFVSLFSLGKQILLFALAVLLAAPMLLIGSLVTLPILFLWIKLFEYIGKSEKDVFKGTKTLMYLASSVAIIVLTVVLAAFVLGNPANLLNAFLLVSFSMLLVVGAFMLISLISKPAESGGKTMLFLALTTVVVVGTILMVTYMLSKMTDDTKDNLWGAFGLVIGSMLGVAIAYSIINSQKSNLIQGGMTMLFLGIVTVIIVGLIIGVSYLLLDLQKKSGEQDTSTFGIVAGAVGIVVISLLAVAGATAIIGSMSGQLIPGAAGMILVAGAMLIYAFALKKFVESGVTGDDILLLTGSLTAVSLVATLLGNPFTVAFTLAGAGSLILISGALYVFTNSLVNFSKSDWNETKTENLTTTVSTIVNSIKDVFSDFSLKDFAKTLAGVGLLGGIGNSLSALGKGLSHFANLEMVKYIQNDKGELIVDPNSSPQAIDPKAIGNGIKAMLAPLIDKDSVLYELGKTEGTFFAGPVGKGIALLGKLGNAIGNFAKGLINMAELRIPAYDENGFIIEGKFTSLKPTFADDVGNSIKMMVKSLTGPLEDLGKKDGGWFSSTNFEKGLDMLGKLGEPLNQLVNVIKAFSSEKLDTTKIEPTLTGLFKPLNSFFTSTNLKKFDVGKGSKVLALSTGYIEKLTNLKKPEDISKMFVDVSSSINKIDLKKLEKLNSLARNLSNFAKEMSGNFTELSKVLEQLTEALGNLDLDKGSVSIPQVSSAQNAINTANNNNSTGSANNQEKLDITPIVKELKSILTTLQGGIEVETKNNNMF